MAGSSTKQTGAASRRARAAAARDAERRAERRRRLLVLIGGGLAVVVVVVAVVLVATVNRPAAKPVSFVLPADPGAAVTAAGLPLLSSEGTVEHIHAHLDAYVDGKHVPVPADIGIASDGSGISPLHTHDSSGIIHVESPVKKDYTLGQFFKEWQVDLSASCLSTRCDGVTAYVNGKPVAGNPANLVLHAHDEIVLVAGSKPASIPSSYTWPQGL